MRDKLHPATQLKNRKTFKGGAKKSLGQNFLTCLWAIDASIKAAHLTKQDIVLEIGPGNGALTRPLAMRAKQVIAVEKDNLLAAQLTQELKQKDCANGAVITGDILKDFSAIAAAHRLAENGYKVVANIPYYASSRLIRLLLETGPRPSHIIFMLQKEVALRICAKPPFMNLLALSVQAYGSPRIITNVPSSCFSPKPKVDSAIISISDISDSFFLRHHIEQKTFFAILRRAFSHKRKMLVNTLTDIASKKDIESALAAVQISPYARPQELSKEQWTQLVAMTQK